MTRLLPCPDPSPHGEHEWIGDDGLRNDCPGVPELSKFESSLELSEEVTVSDELVEAAARVIAEAQWHSYQADAVEDGRLRKPQEWETLRDSVRHRHLEAAMPAARALLAAGWRLAPTEWEWGIRAPFDGGKFTVRPSVEEIARGVAEAAALNQWDGWAVRKRIPARESGPWVDENGQEVPND